MANLIARYPIYPSTGDEVHHAPTYACTVHCECNDHYYRGRDCKHLRAWFAQVETEVTE